MATTIDYQVTGMTCGHCEGAIRSEVSEIDANPQQHANAV